MTIEQTVEIPSSHILFINVPAEVPAGKAIISFTPVTSTSKTRDLESAGEIWADIHTHPEKFKAKLQSLQGSLTKNAFESLNGVAYQHKTREEWEN